MLTDPTYLRYIFDGLESQSIHKDNISALPEGLIGIYEEALPQEHNVQDRERFLSFFSTWALLKKEVSASIISKILNWHEQDVIDCLSIYTKWFNSPTSGTYLLYHERLRVFLLEKVSSQQLHLTNQKIISLCQTALEQRKGDEWELYALEHLPSHLLIPAMQQEQGGAEYRKLVNDKGFWNRQVEINKGYDWTKKMLNQSMGWAAKQSKDELIECALNKIDLHYMEQNDAPRIVELVAQNDIDIALQLIEAFGGNDMEGLQKKFTLYMLCLMELTLLDSKDKPFRKSAIAKILNHLDENIPIDHSLLNWNDFFPSYLMFQMSCEWAEMGLDYVGVYKRTEKWDSNWIEEKGVYTDLQFEVLMSCAESIRDDSETSMAFAIISTELAKQSKEIESSAVMKESLNCARIISDNNRKSRAFIAISSYLILQGKVEKASSVIDETIYFARGIDDDYQKSYVLGLISTKLSNQGKVKEASDVMQEGLSCSYGISYDYIKNNALSNISIELAKQRKVIEAISCSYDINDNIEKSRALIGISTELFKQGNWEEALSMSKNALSSASGISDEGYKSSILVTISIELMKQDHQIAALSCARDISNDADKSCALATISTELARKGKGEDAFAIMQEALYCASSISVGWQKRDVYFTISKEQAKQGFIKKSSSAMQEAITCDRGISDDHEQSIALKNIYIELVKQGKVDEALSCVHGISIELYKTIAPVDISLELAKLGRVDEALFIASGISDEDNKSRAIAEISIELAKNGRIKEALSYANLINDEFYKSLALAGCSIELAEQDQKEAASSTMMEAISCAKNIIIDRVRSRALARISIDLAKQGKFVEAISCASGISVYWKNNALASICSELSKQDQVNEALSCSLDISDISDKDHALLSVSTQLAKKGHIDEAISCAKGIIIDRVRSRALVLIYTELAREGQKDSATSVMHEAISYARQINDDSDKSISILEISIELAKQGFIEQAEEVGLEIPQSSYRYTCWKDHAETALETISWDSALLCVQRYKRDEPRLFYLKGWSEHVAVKDLTSDCVEQALPYLFNDSESIQALLQRYAQHELFFGTPSQEKIDRLNRTLNLQWALDIIAQFPKDETGIR